MRLHFVRMKTISCRLEASASFVGFFGEFPLTWLLDSLIVAYQKKTYNYVRVSGYPYLLLMFPLPIAIVRY